MIKTVKISNFKSVQELEIELGRINVFIGENGCGKTSILEGIAMGAAAFQGKVDNEFLVSRGIRIADSKLMKSAFEDSQSESEIIIDFQNDSLQPLGYKFDVGGPLQKPWEVQLYKTDQHGLTDRFTKDLLLNEQLVKLATDSLKELFFTRRELLKDGEGLTSNERLDIDNFLQQAAERITNRPEVRKAIEQGTKDYLASFNLSNFLLYAPENNFLRNFHEEGQIDPLGNRGEGLFRHLANLSKEAPETFTRINDHLSLIDWFGRMSIPTNLQFTERRIAITDRFIADTIQEFDQRSANEGFLYLLFYFTLFLSKYTPKFFAIDNIDNALNPRLCAKLVEVLAKIAKEEDKQAILTTHNPAVLDGLDLKDDEQRLFVIFRNADGETKARRVKPMIDVPGTKPVRLSEAFVRGYLGGLPANF